MTATHTRPEHTAKQEWATGLTAFAAVMLFLVGLLDIFRGIMAIAEDDIFLTTRNYVFAFDLTGWGWIHLILGVVAVLVSMGLFQGAGWARVVGVGIAGLVIIANFLSLPYYPVWSVVMITISGFIIWAVCVVQRDNLFDLSEERPPSEERRPYEEHRTYERRPPS
jgi:divalent metal cation (Fe/Co/Zn/Cd) transporter